MFNDRKDAGEKLGAALKPYAPENPVLLAIPRGGVEVGLRAASVIGADFDIIIVRKLPLPGNPEAGFGAIAEDGSTQMAARLMSPREKNGIIREQEDEIARRVNVLRGGRRLPPLEGRTVIIVDDGVAMGSTMAAAVKMCRKKKAARVIAAAPVAGPEAARELSGMADETVILEIPPGFSAVAESYRAWYDVTDEEVIELMRMREG